MEKIKLVDALAELKECFQDTCYSIKTFLPLIRRQRYADQKTRRLPSKSIPNLDYIKSTEDIVTISTLKRQISEKILLQKTNWKGDIYVDPRTKEVHDEIVDGLDKVDKRIYRLETENLYCKTATIILALVIILAYLNNR